MRTTLTSLALALLSQTLTAADLPPDKGNEIPESGKRPTVLTGKPTQVLPKHDLPEGYKLELAAAAPLVTHPIMGCLDDKGRLFVGDAVGVNWNKAQLDANPPNRVLLLEDTDKDGVYDKSTIFADKMTFPQGALWLDGSLYVGSPPCLWKLTDTDNDGVADQREAIVSGYDYTGNAADIHGPFLHPNGRLYWCHGRKGYKVPDKEGNIVQEGKSSGIWSCKPDGSDVQWHSLLAGDNPVEVDFTPDGDIVGVQNLYYSQPRGDTIVHWLYGGVYERRDQMKVIEGLPRTLDTMPVMYNFGHVAVSGCCFWRSYASPNLQFLVTHFNTQRLVRMELTPAGATYKATENEFVKLHDPDIHLTDVMEDPRDGSLLLINTGGWFRIGCPSSLMAKSDILGAIYRIVPPQSNPAPKLAALPKPSAADLESTDPHTRLHALAAMAQDTMDGDAAIASLKKILSQELDAPTEHAAIFAARRLGIVSMDDLRNTANPVALRRMLVAFEPDDAASTNLSMGIAAKQLDAEDTALASTALGIVTQHSDADEWVAPTLRDWLRTAPVSSQRLRALLGFCTPLIDKQETQKLIGMMLSSAEQAVRFTALQIIAGQSGNVSNADWISPLEKMSDAADTPLPLLLDAIKRLKSPAFDPRLQAIADDTKRPLSLRLKALDSMAKTKLTAETFALLKTTLTDSATSAAAKIQAATMLAAAPAQKEEQLALAPVFATVGPIELKELMAVARKSRDVDVARAIAAEIAKNPAIGSQQESIYRTTFNAQPPEIFETVLLPAIQKAEQAVEAKKRQLSPLSDKAVRQGDATAGKLVYESGKGTCIACHKIGEVGRPIGPDLSHIGAIRTERDILESILFPSNTLARDYEAHLIETSDGQQAMAVIKSHTAEGLLVVDIAGQERNIPHQSITGDTTLPTSLMPMGLDQTLPEKDLLDLVAWLRSLK